MAESINLGEALGLQTNLQPDKRQPFTNATIRAENLSLKAAAQAAKQAADDDKLRQQIAKSVTLDPGKYGAFYSEQAKKIADDGVYEMMKAAKNKDQLGVQYHKEQTMQKLGVLADQNTRLNNFHESERTQGTIIPDEIKAATSLPYSQGHPRLQQLLKDHPEYGSIVNYDVNGNYSFNYVKNLDLSAAEDKFIKDNEHLMTNITSRKKVDANTDQLLLGMSKEQLRSGAVGIAGDRVVQANVELKHKADYDKAYATAKENAPMATPDAWKHAAVTSVIENHLTPKNVREHWESRPLPQNNGLSNLGLTSLNNDDNQNNSIVITRPTTYQGKVYNREFAVTTGKPHNFKPIEIQTIRGDGMIDLNGNKPLNGQTINQVKTGNTIMMPVANRNLVSLKTGDKVKRGEIIDDKRLKTALDQGAVTYVPMLSLSATIKRKNERGKMEDVTISAVAPLDQYGNAVLLSQSKDDVPGTQQQLQASIDEANQKNAEIKNKHNNVVGTGSEPKKKSHASNYKL